MNKRTLFIVHAAVIAALYVVLTLLAATFNLANGAIQIRFSEALTILPYFTPAGIYGVTIGCFLSNILTGCAIPDIIFGTLATLIGAIGTYILKKNRWLAPLPPIVSNMIIIPVILTYAYHIPGGIPFLMLTVGAGEVISCYVIGEILLSAINPVKQYIFGTPEVSRADITEEKNA